MVTGESRTVRRGVGEAATAGTVSTDPGLRVEVTATGEDGGNHGSPQARPPGTNPRPRPAPATRSGRLAVADLGTLGG